MAFLTKLRTFLDPNCYCVLDGKIASVERGIFYLVDHKMRHVAEQCLESLGNTSF